MILSCENSTSPELKQCFISCKTHLQTIYKLSFQRQDILTWFQALCAELTTLIGLIGTHYKQIDAKTQPPQQTILLYLTQLLTTLSLLINIFVTEEEVTLTLTEARKCILKQMTCCLESLEISLQPDSVPLNEPFGSFVKWMDAALEKVAQINVNESRSRAISTFQETREIFEEVLSHAMSIAQIALSEDSKIIRGSCQSVLTALNSLEKELKSTFINGAVVTLFIDASSDKLCLLEKKVNTAVLKLCLKIFSEFTVPLEKIHDFCFEVRNKDKVEEFDVLVADFDLHVDRIMQIGLFAVSCSSDLAKGIKIRSCLASLEALESELVPTLSALLMEHSLHNVNTAYVLVKHWIEQANCMKKLIFLIIDPFAFCQVIYEDCVDIIDVLSNSLRRKNLIKQENIEKFLLSAKVLQTFLQHARSDFSQNEISKIEPKLKDYNEVMEEVEKASRILLTNDTINVENCKRVLKRCKILLTVLKRLWHCFTDDISQNKNSKFEKHLDDLPSNLESLHVEPTGNPFLDYIINRGKQILQDRSVLYKTPIKSGGSVAKSVQKEIPLSKLVHLRKLSFANSTNQNEPSLDLQITNILSDMMNLSRSLKP